MNRKYLYYPLAAAGALLAVYLLVPNEEDRILDRLQELRTLSEVGGPEPAIEQALTARRISELVRLPLVVDMHALGLGVVTIEEEQQLQQSILKIRAALSLLDLQLRAPKIVLNDDHADVELLGSALGTMRSSGSQFLEIHRVVISLVKVDGDWLVSGARHLRDERATPTR